MFEVG